ncbi:MAG: NUDIX hydrolase [Chloroflexi bacterium]|nr:NUDIX hydrolase [Chloroflexota bacterium]
MPTPEDPLREQLVGSDRLYEGHIVNLRKDTLQLSDGREVTREIVEHSPAVVILAFDDEGRIAFVRQWRSATGQALLELPAGGVDPGETPEQAAARELQEEVGLKPGKLEPLRGFWVAPGWATEYLHGFVARDCERASLPADADERIEVHYLTLGEAMARIEEGEIKDAKTIILLQAIALRAAGPLVNKIVRYYRGE